MMTPAEIMADVRRRGVRLIDRGDRLGVDAPSSELTAKLREVLATHKAALLELLRAETRRDHPVALGDRVETPWRQVLAGWPDDRREAWGRRADELEDLGHPWHEAEALAFAEVSGHRPTDQVASSAGSDDDSGPGGGKMIGETDLVRTR